MLLFKENQIIAGRYKLERQVAKGGMGAVWTARNLQLNIPVAVKFMAPETIGSAELVARFEREARAAAQLRSPHVVHIYEHGVVQDTPFMVMELLEGEDLSKRLRTRGRLSIAETARIVTEVCKALRRAHEQNIVHRDLKPGNIFLCRQDEDEIIKVLDFGIAKILVPGPDEEVTKTGALVGTPHYMSPEQARRTQKDVDHRTDLWALGVIAYRALTGRLPFAGETGIDVLLRVCNDSDPIPAPSSVATDLGPDVDRFFARALTRSPEGRFQSARELAEAMNGLVPRAPGADVSPLGRSWSESGPNAPAARVPTASSPARGPLVQPGVHMVEARVYTSVPVPSAPQPAEAHDPMGIAATVPIARSAVGQALLRDARGGPSGTLPIHTPALPESAPRARPDGSGGRPAQAPAPSALAAQAAGDVAGTITSAATETSSRSPRRGQSSWIVWVAAAAAVLVVGVVAWAGWMATGDGSSDAADSPPIIPLPIPPPPEASDSAPEVPPASRPEIPPAAVSASASATASASEAPTVPAPTQQPATRPTASASVGPKKGSTPAPSGGAKATSAPPVPAPKEKPGSGMMGAPTF